MSTHSASYVLACLHASRARLAAASTLRAAAAALDAEDGDQRPTICALLSEAERLEALAALGAA